MNKLVLVLFSNIIFSNTVFGITSDSLRVHMDCYLSLQRISYGPGILLEDRLIFLRTGNEEFLLIGDERIKKYSFKFSSHRLEEPKNLVIRHLNNDSIFRMSVGRDGGYFFNEATNNDEEDVIEGMDFLTEESVEAFQEEIIYRLGTLQRSYDGEKSDYIKHGMSQSEIDYQLGVYKTALGKCTPEFIDDPIRERATEINRIMFESDSGEIQEESRTSER